MVLRSLRVNMYYLGVHNLKQNNQLFYHPSKKLYLLKQLSVHETVFY
jgi:hypothetical protein